jgi:peroxiredoxin
MCSMVRGSVVALALLFAAGAAGAAGAQQVGGRVGHRAPAVTLPTLDGESVDIGSYVGTRPVVLHFFAAWCSQCRDQMPSLQEAVRRYGGRVKFIGVAVSANQSRERARRYVRAHRMTHDIVYDVRGDAVERFNVPTTSYVVVIDRSGRIVFTGSGSNLDIVAAAARAL